MPMFFKNIIKLLVPEIFTKKGIWKLKRLINDKIRNSEKILFEKNFYNRTSFIQKALANFDLSSCKYLEIGTFQNETFNTIPLPLHNKFGVDPNSGGNIRLSSDDFFQKNKNKFDVIFIDGLHTYEQCQKDVINSLNFLNENGFILIHDLLPKNKFQAQVPRKQDIWNGDVWKVGVELNNSKNIKFIIANIDHGVGIVKCEKNFQYKKMNDILKDKEFKSFYSDYYKKLPIVNSEKALLFINN
tara:strand:+ start:1847 stop:2575 length:729 start_codon:yes stop_codon:yes gene_type:complete